MSRTRPLLQPGIILDARRAVWLEEERALAVADLHLGFLWAHRARGSLFPLGAVDDAIPRLSALVSEYQPKEVLLLGDIVHRAVPLEPVRAEIRALTQILGGNTKLRLLGGNHDRGLAELLVDCGLDWPVEKEVQIGGHVLLHGDVPPSCEQIAGRIFMGHEHPAVHVGDGIASAKCPCFMVGPRVVVLPAFSQWAAGSNVRGAGGYMSALAQGAGFTHAVAILAGKLLPLPVR